jgi:hypothetical protein
MTIDEAAAALTRHTSRAADGTFVLSVRTAQEAGIDDPVLFADLVRSIEHTNELIRRGEIKAEDVEC